MQVEKKPLPERNLHELLTLLAISETQCRIVRKEIKRLVGKLLSVHL